MSPSEAVPVPSGSLSICWRLVRLALAAKVRSVGIAPPVLFCLWLLVAGLQEPRTLRGFGVSLLGQAAAVGGLAMLVPLLLAGQPRAFGSAAIASATVLAVVAVAQAGAAFAVDAALGFASIELHARSAVHFVIAWLPFAAALTCEPRVDRVAQRAAEWALVVVALVLGATLAVRMWGQSATLAELLACACGVAAASLPRRVT